MAAPKIRDAPAAAATETPSAGVSSIKVVSELTGLPMGTLRAWERRYGFPRPARRAGSNRRLYSKVDVDRLRILASAVAHGYRPGDVIALPTSELLSLLGEGTHERMTPGGKAIADVSALIDLLVLDDVRGIEDELRLAAAALGAKRFVTDLAHPLALAVGQAWAEGKLAIRQEHLMTECLTTQLRTLLASQQSTEGAPTVLLTTLPGEPHTLGLQMVALYVAISAAKPRLLGASTPPEQIIAAARALDARVVGLTVTPTMDLAEAAEDLRRLARGLPSSVTLWVGGSGVRALGKIPSRVQVVDSWASLDTALDRARGHGPRQ